MGPTEPRHLDHNHGDTLAKIFGHPVGHNIEWRGVLSPEQDVTQAPS